MKKDLNKQKAPGFASRLKASRLDAGLTQQDLADSLSITLRNYQKYEAADTEPSLYNLITIAITLQVSVDYLLGLSGEAHAGEC